LRGVFSDVPIILCASPGWPQDGADVLLDKPFRRSRLISALSRVTNQAVEEGWNSLPAPHPQTLRKSIDTFNHITELIEVGEPLVYDRVVDVCAPLVDAVTGSQYKPLLNALQRHDNAHYVHSLRVATLLSLFGHSIGLKDDALLILATGGLLHDLGKTLEGLNIVNEPRRLTAQELKKVHWHVTSTLDYLEHHTDVPKGVRTIALLHHERLDGSGYPNGIKGAKLNDLARMAAIVDVYSALTERRSYRPALMAKDAFALMSTEMHASLDQRLLGIFRDLLENGACDA
jgi:HD-GYP domain-containing protein (c-di-GMP phosphodiesterase class II)